MITLSILHSYVCPRKSFRDHFPGTRRMQPRKKETKTRMGNVLVVAVLVAGVTFAGAIQLPQLRGNLNSSEHHHEFHGSNITASHKISTAFYSPTDYEGLLYGYLSCDVWALSLSLVAALSLLRANFGDPRFEIIGVGLSVFMVGSAILMMFVAFIYAVTIALLGSHDAWLKITITVEAFMGFYAVGLIVIPWALPFESIPDLQGMLLHYFYYIYFLFLFYTYEWLPYKIYKRTHK